MRLTPNGVATVRCKQPFKPMQLMGGGGDMQFPGAELARIFTVGVSAGTSDVCGLERLQ